MIKKYFNRFIKAVSCKKFLTCLFIFCYLLGIILGIVLNNNEEDLEIVIIVKNYHDTTLGLYSNPFKLTITRLLNNFFYFLLVYIFCYKIYLCIFNLIIFMYRGVILGSVAITFFEVLGIEGIIIYAFLIIAQNFLVSFALFYSCIIIYHLRGYCKKRYTDNLFLKYVLIGYVISVIVALYEFIFIFAFMRPLNLYF